MSLDPTLARAIERDQQRERPDWHDGTCERCGEELLVLDVDHAEFDELCLSCCDDCVEDGDLTALATGV
ncbi:hypothetical protein [Halococcus sp. AFM35]|uniref:hypothetical protein n=1 Tax=Halococcus sp. AFM35 TaxID=3421653 RepID=UPI003EC0C0A9